MTAFSIAAIVAGNLALGPLVARFRDGGELLGVRFSNGFEPQALVVAALAAAFFYLSVAFVRERPPAQGGPPPLALRAAVVESFRNPAFLPLVVSLAVFLVGVNVLATVVPYLGRSVLRASEAEASWGAAALYGAAAVSLPFMNRAVARFGKKRTYGASFLAMAAFFSAIPALQHSPRPVATYLVYMLALGPFVGATLVLGRVLISDVIDEDERRTGLRREAMYFGMQGLLTKASFGVGPLLATLLFTAFGNTADEPLGILLCGPLAGSLALVGWLVFRRYPLAG
jgi:GPH family glycoside/pentoside/hexuronide:cation symporter